jgi:outer membrane lipoprotein SlyB
MKRIDRRVIGVVAAAIGLAACVQTPVAPMIPVAPGPNKTFDAFGADQAVCQQYAAAQTAPAVAAANNQAVGGAILTTALGAGLGAAIGGGRGAAIGAASGAGLGTVVGASGSSYAQMSVQQQYDILYGQCMAAHGNSVPGFSPPPDAPRYPGGAGPGPQPYPGAPAPPPPGYGPSGYSPPGYGPPGYGPPGYGPPGYGSPAY